MRLGLGLCLALGSAVALNWSYFAQHGAAAALPRLEPRRPVRSLRLLFSSRRWLVGFLVGIAGWAFYVAALGLAPLALVQATSAGGIGVLALLIQLGPGGTPLVRREWGAVGVALAGLVLLGVSLAGSHSAGRVPGAPAVGLWLLGACLAGALTLASTRIGAPAAAALGITAGLLYATGDISTKATLQAGHAWFAPAIFAAHGLAFVCLQFGFQRGSAIVTAGLATLLTNAVPIAAGTALFGERLPAGGLGDCRLAAFVLVVAAAGLLSRSDEPAVPVSLAYD